MRFEVERSELADAVAWTARSLPARPPVAVLAGLLLDTTGDGLMLSGFDFEVATTATVPATVAEEGRAVVSGRLLAEIVRSLPAAPVKLHSDGSRVVLSCGSSRFTLPTMQVEDYPQLPAMPGVAGRIPASVFAQAVGQVVVAAGRDDTLPVLTGVRVEFDGERLTLIATDRYRMTMRELAWQPEAVDLPAAVLVPARNIAEAARALTGSGDVVLALATGEAGDSLMGFAGSDRTTTTRLLDGEYPRVRSLMPTSHTAEATMPTAALVDAVRRVSLVAQRTSPVRLSLSGGELLLEAGADTDAQASEILEIGYDGEPFSIAFNPQFLLDGLGVLDDAQTKIAFTDPKRPAVMSGAESAGYSYLLMPVRLSS